MSKFGAISKAARRAAIRKRLGKNAPRRGMGDDYNIGKAEWNARKGRKPKPARAGGDGWLKYVAGTSAAAYGGNKIYRS